VCQELVACLAASSCPWNNREDTDKGKQALPTILRYILTSPKPQAKPQRKCPEHEKRAQDSKKVPKTAKKVPQTPKEELKTPGKCPKPERKCLNPPILHHVDKKKQSP
jgi:hypothetical protein